MKRKIKQGSLIGGCFAIIAYGLARINGFNRTTFLIFLYLYVITGAVSRLQLEDLSEYAGALENLIWIKEEEKKLKKIFTGEEYEIEGDVKKL